MCRILYTLPGTQRLPLAIEQLYCKTFLRDSNKHLFTPDSLQGTDDEPKGRSHTRPAWCFSELVEVIYRKEHGVNSRSCICGKPTPAWAMTLESCLLARKSLILLTPIIFTTYIALGKRFLSLETFFTFLVSFL